MGNFLNTTLGQLIATATLIGMIVTGVWQLDARHASASEFEEYLASGAVRIMEADLWRLQDRLTQLQRQMQRTPPEQRQWIVDEIERLKIRIKQLQQKIQQT